MKMLGKRVKLSDILSDILITLFGSFTAIYFVEFLLLHKITMPNFYDIFVAFTYSIFMSGFTIDGLPMFDFKEKYFFENKIFATFHLFIIGIVICFGAVIMAVLSAYLKDTGDLYFKNFLFVFCCLIGIATIYHILYSINSIRICSKYTFQEN